MGSQNIGIRTFKMHRVEDVSGTSGTGVVAEGAIFTNTKVIISWLTIHKSMAIYDSLAEMEAVHGHDGRTKVVWDDEVAVVKATKKTVLDET